MSLTDKEIDHTLEDGFIKCVSRVSEKEDSLLPWFYIDSDVDTYYEECKPSSTRILQGKDCSISSNDLLSAYQIYNDSNKDILNLVSFIESLDLKAKEADSDLSPFVYVMF